MEVEKLCEELISQAVQRCRLRGDPCRVSIIFKPSPFSPLTHISISDTGAGSCLKEFQGWKLGYNGVSDTVWDGVLSITTTSLDDSELFHYKFNLKETVLNRRLTKLPSTPKKNAIFSGTEVSISIATDMEVFLEDINTFLKKVLILKIYNIAIELMIMQNDQHGLQQAKVILATELALPSPESSNLEQLSSGLEDYVCSHRSRLSGNCQSCFSTRDNLKVGNGQACKQNSGNDALVVDVVIIISDMNELLGPSTPSCLTAFEPKTEVLYFRDFSPCSVHQSALKALKCIKWNNYGLTLSSVNNEESCPLLEWDNMPPNTHIDIVLHCYNKQTTVPPLRQKPKIETKLVKEAISRALDDLKDMYTGALLSDHALKIHNHAPDLARSIAGLILSSDDPNFQGKCYNLLGMKMGNVEGAFMENCIKEKIISVIDMNDRRLPSLATKAPAPFLLSDEHLKEPEFMWDDYEQDEEDDCTLMDL